MKAFLFIALAAASGAASSQVREGQSFTTQFPAIVRLGTATAYGYGLVQAGTWGCNLSITKGIDPAPGKSKACTVYPIDGPCLPPLFGGDGQGTQAALGLASGYAWWWCKAAAGTSVRVMAGTSLATVEAAKCVIQSTKAASVALATCAPGDVTKEPLLSIWWPYVDLIVKSKP